MFSDVATWQAGLSIAILAVAVVACWRDDNRLAWCFGFLLPIDFVTGVPTAVFDVARYAGVVWLIYRVKPDLSPSATSKVFRLAAAIASVAIVRGLFAIPRSDRNSMIFAGVMLVSTACAALLAQRTRVHASVAFGFLSGLFLSAMASILQALHMPALRAGNRSGHRYPGLSTYTMLLTWQLAFGIVLCLFLIAASPHGSRRRTFGWVLMPVFILAMMTNGAQGGLAGLVAGIVALAWAKRSALSWSSARRYIAWGVGGVAGLIAVILLTGIDIPTIDGLTGEGGYGNENARWTVAVQGVHEMRLHPFLGVGRTNFMDRYGIAPHFLPIDSGVTAGILGFAVAAYLLWVVVKILIDGPADDRPVTTLGFVMIAVMFSNTITESYGPFIGLSRVTVLFLALAAVSGGESPDPGEPVPARRVARSRDPDEPNSLLLEPRSEP